MLEEKIVIGDEEYNLDKEYFVKNRIVITPKISISGTIRYVFSIQDLVHVDNYTGKLWCDSGVELEDDNIML